MNRKATSLSSLFAALVLTLFAGPTASADSPVVTLRSYGPFHH